MQKKTGLGRGLEALLGEIESPIIKDSGSAPLNGIEKIKIDKIKGNKNQPRKTFDQEKIAELADSIREHGIIQPIIIRKVKGGYEIVAGERRWRAAREAGLKEVPCIIRDLTDRENMIFSIIENLQREGLNPIEEAEGFQEMIKVYNLTQEEVSKSVGKSRPYITNQLRLLKLPKEIRKLLVRGVISTGHAKVLSSVTDEKKQIRLADEIANRNLSVRDTERLVKEDDEPKVKKNKKENVKKSPEARLLERELEEKIGTKIEIVETGNNGKIIINYFSKEERDRIVEKIQNI